MSVLAFPVPADRVLTLIRDAASAERVIYPRMEEDGAWYEMTTRRQVMKCLKEGNLTGDPITNSNGHMECSMSMFCAGVNVKIDLVIKNMDGWSVIIIKVENRL